MNAPSATPRTVNPAQATKRPPPDALIRTAVMTPDDQADEASEEDADDKRPDPRIDGQLGRVTDGLVRLVEQVETEDDADDDPDDDGQHERSADPPTRHADAGQDRGHGDREEEQDAVDHTPADRAEEPLPDQQRRADDEQEDGEDDEHERQGAERQDPTDLAGDRAGFGLGELDMGEDQDPCRIKRGLELFAQARRLGARLPRRRAGRLARAAGRRRRWLGRVRVVQGGRSGRVRGGGQRR